MEFMKQLEVRFRRTTASFRLLPNFIIIGGQKCGTTSLFHYLREHPRVRAPTRKETHYFTTHFASQRLAWYRSLFPTLLHRLVDSRILTFEASPGYLYNPYAAKRIKNLLPDVKLIVSLRNPVDRAYSHYHHSVRIGKETLPFEQAIFKEDERVGSSKLRLEHDPSFFDRALNWYTYLSYGIYADYLKTWFGVFPPSRFLIIKSETFFQDEAASVKQIKKFLGLPEHRLDNYHAFNAGSYQKAPMEKHTRQRLTAYFAPHNQRLYNLLGRDLGW